MLEFPASSGEQGTLRRIYWSHIRLYTQTVKMFLLHDFLKKEKARMRLIIPASTSIASIVQHNNNIIMILIITFLFMKFLCSYQKIMVYHAVYTVVYGLF